MRRRRGRPLVIVLQPHGTTRAPTRRTTSRRRAMFAAGTTRTHEPRARRNGAVAVKQQRFVAKRKGARRTVEGPRGGQRSGVAGVGQATGGKFGAAARR